MRKALGLSFLVGRFQRRPSKGRPTSRPARPGPPPCVRPATARNGISVSDTIPNLAGQRAGYLEGAAQGAQGGHAQVIICKLMNAMAGTVEPHETWPMSRHISPRCPGRCLVPRNPFSPCECRQDECDLPGKLQGKTFTQYHTINFPATKQVRYYFANKAGGAGGPKKGKPLPDGSFLLAEVYAAKLDAERQAGDGRRWLLRVRRSSLFYTTMASGAGWGKDIPEMLRNGNWNYAVFTLDKQHRPAVNQAECLACHKPLDNVSYTFTLKQISEAK